MSSQAVSTSFILSLVGGVIIILAGIVSFFGFMSGVGPFYDGMMGGYHWMMGGYGYSSSAMALFSLVGLVAGILVLIGALMLNARPAEHMLWGIIVLIFSIISFIGMGGFFIGALLGIAGGALALSVRPVSKA